MKKISELAGICIYLFTIFNLSIYTNLIYLTILLTAVFFIQYFKMKYRINNNATIMREMLLKQKEFFIETLNHDIKIPTIAQLRGMELLTNEILGNLNNDQKEIILQSKESCRYVLQMISTCSNIYEFELNRRKLVFEKFNMTELVLSCFKELSFQKAEKNFTFAFSSQNDGITAFADKKEMKKVIINLLNNAINYSNSGNPINVELLLEKNNIKFRISGIDFVTNPSKNYAQYSTIGYSLGMYMCKKILEIHKGKLQIPDTKSISFIIPVNKQANKSA